MTIRHAVGLLLAVTLLVFPSVSFAQDEAMAFFEDGAALYYEGKYAEALVEFKKAHAAAPNAMFQYNIAMCHVRLKRWSEALEAAEKAKKMGGLGDKGTAQNDGRIAAVHRVVSTLNVADDVSAQQAREVAAATPDEVPADPEITETTTTPEKRFGGLGWVGVGAAGVGAGLLAGALVSDLTLQPKWDEYRAAAAAGDEEQYEALKSTIESRQGVGRVLLFSGIGLTAVGATLIIVELARGPSEPTAVLLPLPGGGAAASFSLRF